MPDVGVNRCCANPDEHLMVPDRWLVDLAELQVLEHVAERDVQRGSASEALEPCGPGCLAR
jgi:hypothetical protein